jgi:putative membrane protein
MKIERIPKQFNWRFLLVRIVVNALALVFTAAVLPKIYFIDKTFWNLLLMAFMLGLLNALLKPILQFLTLQFIFVTYGLVVVLVNALLLWLLSFIFPNRFEAGGLVWLLLGGLVLGLLSSFLESLLGLTMPIVPDEPPELRQQVKEQARQVDWVASRAKKALPEEQAMDIEPTSQEANVSEPSIPGPDEESSPSLEVQMEPSDPVVSAEPEPLPKPRDEQKEE